MCWRRVSKAQKLLFTILFYLITYLIVSYNITPKVTYNFIPEDKRIGEKYIIMYLIAPMIPLFTDADGALVFNYTHCGNCFITNNQGFMPVSEFDAVLVLGNRSKLTQSSAFMDPEKRYLIESAKRCIKHKLRSKGCVRQATVTSFSTREKTDLCGLCHTLHEKRRVKKLAPK